MGRLASRAVRHRRWAAIVTLAATAMAVLLPAPPAHGGGGGVRLVARVDGVALDESSETRPIALHPDRPAAIAIEVANLTAATIEIRTVRMSGTVLGLAFFAYETAVRLRVDPGATVTAAYRLDLGDLDGQATGLVMGSVSLLDADRSEIVAERMVVDVRGSLRSVYGAFGVAVATLTAASIVALLLGVARHKLPANRWRRALRFLGPGIGLGLTVVFTLSALRVFVPRPGRWVPIVVIAASVAVIAGYLTPTPDDPDDDLDDDLDDGPGREGGVDASPRQAGSAAGPEHPRPPGS